MIQKSSLRENRRCLKGTDGGHLAALVVNKLAYLVITSRRRSTAVILRWSPSVALRLCAPTPPSPYRRREIIQGEGEQPSAMRPMTTKRAPFSWTLIVGSTN
jgi:hypothetical protein